MHKVLTGSEEPGVSPAGINYTVSWTTDENGQLVVNDTVEDEARTLAVTVPPPGPDTSAGAPPPTVSVEVDGSFCVVDVPPGLEVGAVFQATQIDAYRR